MPQKQNISVSIQIDEIHALGSRKADWILLGFPSIFIYKSQLFKKIENRYSQLNN